MNEKTEIELLREKIKELEKRIKQLESKPIPTKELEDAIGKPFTSNGQEIPIVRIK